MPNSQKIIEQLTDPTLPTAVGANFAEEMGSMATVLPGAERFKDADLEWFTMGPGRFNGVLLAHFQTTDPAYIEARLEKLSAFFQERDLTWAWFIQPGSQPTNLATYLPKHGLLQQAPESIMLANLTELAEAIPVPNLVIEEIRTEDQLKHLRDIQIVSFETTLERGQLYYDAYHALGFGPGHPWHHYLGIVNDQPVAVCSLLLHAGLAGIYGVATLPEARRQGIGSALTLHAMREAFKLGYRIAQLSPSEIAINVYRRIGFHDYCTIPFFLSTAEK